MPLSSNKLSIQRQGRFMIPRLRFTVQGGTVHAYGGVSDASMTKARAINMGGNKIYDSEQ